MHDVVQRWRQNERKNNEDDCLFEFQWYENVLSDSEHANAIPNNQRQILR